MLWTPITSRKTVILQKLEVYQTWAISLRIYLAMAQRCKSGRQKSAEVDMTMLGENLQEVQCPIVSLHLKEIVMGQ